MVKTAKKCAREPFPERTVIELPRYRRILSPYFARIDEIDLADPGILEKDLDRRSFVMSLFGGLAAASLGGIAIAQAASPKPEVMPSGPEIDAATKAGLDEADAEFSQYHRHHRGPRHHYRPRHHRPPVHRQVHRRPRRVVRNGRVYYVR